MKEEGTNKINREALFSAETEDYRSPMEPKDGNGYVCGCVPQKRTRIRYII